MVWWGRKEWVVVNFMAVPVIVHDSVRVLYGGARGGGGGSCSYGVVDGGG